MKIEKVMVVGSGQMGSGIAQVLAQTGYQVVLNDIKEELVQKGMSKIAKQLDRDIQKGRRTEEEKAALLSKIVVSTNLEDAKDVQLVIEAATENKEIKLGIFRKLDQAAPEQAILASNTSSLPITEIAAATNRPEKVIGMHFFNPVPVMKLVEVNRGLATSEETFSIIEDLAKEMKKVPVAIKDFPGFAVNRILIPMINEAIYAVYEGIASPEGIDEVMKLGANHPMGPITLADYIGLDTCLAIMEVLYDGFGDPKYRPCPLLRKYVEAGWLGVKTGRGFYVYN
ncbi:3-hydroxybutyryl-CoA dehydrogenase [Niallia endozanthoxylica]|uniref:3-hydroxybutyryl-CoA dehydrogenase n=1 Tax=Niallia endozanthoxylica TaxID=2036016 RepID=A0A5J5H641_9BACI|nr:3-hydroxybutyryl-CoA dehydrogenase [Niallia endozanthoxylica]KAA9015737.1 3-hydroxybutyryl-CoA dehydrogenase [Niallia endozanthoxylica]